MRLRDENITGLEKLRLMIEAGGNMTGMLYDYLDRGLPSQEQASLTWTALKTLEERDRDLRDRFERDLDTVLRDDPGTVREWAGRHVAICSGVLQRGERGESGYPDPRLEVLFARKYGEEWKRVASGEKLCVIQHSLMMQYHRDLQEREFGRIEGTDEGLPRYPWEKQE